MRNQQGLTPEQIEQAQLYWCYISENADEDFTDPTLKTDVFDNFSIKLDVSEAHISGSKTRFIENRNIVMLGADAFPNDFAIDANSKMSLLACLCHEFAHAQRYCMGFRRPFRGRDINLDEAETSIHASYMPVLSPMDREHLIEDAMQRLDIWKKGETE